MEKLLSTIYQANRNIDSQFSIVIPTYDRLKNLITNLNWLNDLFIENSFEVIVLDNNSSYDSSELLCHLGSIKYPISIYKNVYHLGPDSNLIRAMELANKEWVLLLGDSKLLKKESIHLILNDIKSNPDIHSIIYSFDKTVFENLILSDIDSFLKSKIKYGDLFLGANSLCTKSSFVEMLPVLSMMTMTRSMLSIIHLGNLQKNKKVLFSSERIVDQFIKKPVNYNPKLSLLECWAQFSLILGMSFNTLDSRKLNKKILVNENLSTRITFLKFSLIQMIRNRKDIEDHLKRILKWRYTSYVIIHEYILIFSIYLLAKVLRLIKYTK